MKNDELPNDLIIELLPKLGLRDVARFTCLSKTWNHLIYEFLKEKPAEMLLFNSNNKVGAVTRNGINPNFALKPASPMSKLIDCCNGLLLLRLLMEIEEYKVLGWGRQFTSVIYNPITKDFVQIPEPYKRAVPPHDVDAVLAFDPSISHHYKVVQFEDSKGYCYVFSSETSNWSTLNFGHTLSVHAPASRSFYLDGAVYRLSFNHLVRILLDKAINNNPRDGVRALSLPDKSIRGRSCIGMTKHTVLLGSCDGSNVRIWGLMINGDEHDWVLKSTISVETIAKSQGVNGTNRLLDTVLPCAFDPVLDKVFIGIQYRVPRNWDLESLALMELKMRKRKMLVYDLNTQELELYSECKLEPSNMSGWDSWKVVPYFPFDPCTVHLEQGSKPS